jgi:hypothetical protein
LTALVRGRSGSAPPGWIGPLRLPRRWTASWLAGFRALSDNLLPWPRWLGLALLLGLGPVLVDYALGWTTSQVVTALAGLPLLLAAAARDRLHPALTCLGLVVAVHSAGMIALAALDPERLAIAYPPGREYWQETALWIRTGHSEVYDLGWWLPFHLQLAAVMLLWGYLSLGLIPLLQGLYEMDLMNFYVGQLLAHAEGPGVGLLLAWHPWSLCRGIGFLFLTFEVASLSLARLTGEPLSPPGRRWRRWLMGIGFLLADMLIKGTCSETVRQALASQLAG